MTSHTDRMILSGLCLLLAIIVFARPGHADIQELEDLMARCGDNPCQCKEDFENYSAPTSHLQEKVDQLVTACQICSTQQISFTGTDTEPKPDPVTKFCSTDQILGAGQTCEDDCEETYGYTHFCGEPACTCQRKPVKDCSSIGRFNARTQICRDDCRAQRGENYFCNEFCQCEDRLAVPCSAGNENPLPPGFTCRNDCPADFFCDKNCTCQRKIRGFCSAGLTPAGRDICVEDCERHLGSEYYCLPATCRCRKKTEVSCGRDTTASFDAGSQLCRQDCKETKGNDFECAPDHCLCERVSVPCSAGNLPGSGLFCRDDCIQAKGPEYLCNQNTCQCQHINTVLCSTGPHAGIGDMCLQNCGQKGEKYFCDQSSCQCKERTRIGKCCLCKYQDLRTQEGPLLSEKCNSLEEDVCQSLEIPLAGYRNFKVRECVWTESGCESRFKNYCERMMRRWNAEGKCDPGQTRIMVETDQMPEDIMCDTLHLLRTGHGRGCQAMPREVSMCVRSLSPACGQVLRRIFYTEDGCSTVPTEADAERLVNNLRSLLNDHPDLHLTVRASRTTVSEICNPQSQWTIRCNAVTETADPCDQFFDANGGGKRCHVAGEAAYCQERSGQRIRMKCCGPPGAIPTSPIDYNREWRRNRWMRGENCPQGPPAPGQE